MNNGRGRWMRNMIKADDQVRLIPKQWTSSTFWDFSDGGGGSPAEIGPKYAPDDQVM